MESSDIRRQSDTLPSMAASYMEFERVTREGAQFHQRHPSINRGSISTASPISPTTSFGSGPPPPLSFPQSSTNAPNGYISPPDSRRTSGNEEGRQTLPSLEGRQSLPSLQEALYDKLEKSTFPAPSPMQTPPLGSGPFSAGHTTMPRSQPPEALPSVQTLPGSSQMYSHPPPPLPPPPPLQSTAGPGPSHSHESSYARRNSQEHSRTLPPNPYAHTQPPAIPAIRPSDPYPPPPPNVNSSYQQQHPYPPPPHHSTSPQYPPTPSYHNGNGTPTQQYPFPQHPNGGPPPQSSYQHQQPPAHSSSYPYTSRDHGYHEPPQMSPGSGGGLKRNNSGYGIKIEKALSMSTLRRDFETIKDVSARVYHLVAKYHDIWQQQGAQPSPGVLENSVLDFSEMLESWIRSTEALRSCHQVFQELSAKEFAEQNAQKMNTNHSSEYGGDDNHGYADDTRSNGSQQPDAKKIRRGRAAPPGRCHSCHRAETPEWRRGPDGARTLCNACGLHYAKLTRKLNKAPGGGQIAGRKAPNSPMP